MVTSTEVLTTPSEPVVSRLPWNHTPLLESNALSKIAGCKIFMKMDLFQPAGSFKSRGVGKLCLEAVKARETDPRPIRFFSSSGGNAGLAAVTAARMLGQEATVVVPETTTEFMRDKIRAAGGQVITHGESWKEADDYIRLLIEQEESQECHAVYCAPFDDPQIWNGNSTLIDEVLQDMDGTPDAIIASVGGGGLFCGLQIGLERHGLGHIPVVAVETEGAESFNASLQKGELVTLPKITSIATSLGARRVAEKTFQLGLRPNVRSIVLSDAQAAMACCKLVEDERIAVEAACGVSAAVIYNGHLRKILPDLTRESKVLLVVCGGSNITIEMLTEYRKKYDVRI
ncbi:catabolic L-serine/threonine dehydratase [Rhizina undulata]